MMKRRIETALIALLTCMMVGACGSRSGGVDRSELLENLKDSVAAAKTSDDETDSVAAASTSEDEATGTDSDELPESISNLIEEEAYSEALEQLDAYLAEHENSVEGHIERAKARVLASETAEAIRAAIDDYAKAHELSPENSEAVYGLADMYIRQNDFETAQKVIEESLKTVQEDEGVKDLLKSLTSGNVKDGLGRPHKRVYRDGDDHVLGYVTSTYREDGRIASGTGYDENGEVVLSVDFEYDKEGKLIKNLATSTTYHSIEFMLVEREYEKTEDGYSWTEKISYPDGSIREIYKNRTVGSLPITNRDRYNADGEFLDSTVYNYDDGKECRRDTFNADKELIHYEIIEHDELGRIVRQMHYRCNDGVDELNSIHVYEYPGNSKYYSRSYYYRYGSNQELLSVNTWTQEDGEVSLDIDQVEDPAKDLPENEPTNDLPEEPSAED